LSPITGRELLEIKEAEGFTMEELAEHMQLTLGSVKSKIYRAQKFRREGSPPPKELDNEPRRTDRNRDNERTLEANALIQEDADGNPYLLVKSLEDLYELFKLDISEWVLKESIVNFWGNSDNPNSQAKVRLTPRNPGPVHPHIIPVRVQMPDDLPPVHPYQISNGRVFLVPDAHIGFDRDLETGLLNPFHDRKALDVMVQMIQYTKPAAIAILGDWWDLAEWSLKFFRTPEAMQTTNAALREGAWWLAQIRLAAPKARIVFLEGNHEARIMKLVADVAPQLFNLHGVDNVQWPVWSIPNLVDMDAMNIEYIGNYPHGEAWMAPGFRVVHGETVRAKSGATSKVVVEGTMYAEAFGHIHRLEQAVKTVDSIDGLQYLHVFSPGCLCHIDGRVPGSKSQYNWQQGAGAVDVYDDMIQPYLWAIQEGRAIVDGALLLARDRLPEIKEATNLNI
jgi:hypothetical protein